MSVQAILQTVVCFYSLLNVSPGCAIHCGSNYFKMLVQVGDHRLSHHKHLTLMGGTVFAEDPLP